MSERQLERIEYVPRIHMLTAPTAEAGLEVVRTHQPSVVIMDVNLPGMSGIEAASMLAGPRRTRSP